MTAGTGSVSGFSASGSQVTIDLTGVGNAQTITVKLGNVNDGIGLGAVFISVGVLAGDVNGNRSTNSSDVAQTKSEVGQPVTNANFRTDSSANGVINGSDVSLVKSFVGTALP